MVGRSSGGFGALRLGMDRPEVFAVVGSHAGDAAFEVTLRPMFLKASISYAAAGGLEAFCAQITERGPRGPDFDGLFFLATATAYAPEPDAPLPHAALPFDLHTGEPLVEIWSRYLAHDPLVRVKNAKDAIAQLSLVYLDAGDVDEYGAQFAARALESALREAGAKVHFEEFSGGHRGTSYRYEDSLPHLVAALAKD